MIVACMIMVMLAIEKKDRMPQVALIIRENKIDIANGMEKLYNKIRRSKVCH